MSSTEIIVILAATAYAVWRQTQASEVRPEGRFRLAIVYAVVGLAVGGFAPPQGAAGYGLLAVSLALSVVVGVARGLLTQVWREPDGHILRQGTVLAVALFLGLVAAKFAIGTFAYAEQIRDGDSFAQIMVMIALMVAAQAELVWRRAQQLPPGTGVAASRGGHAESHPTHTP